MKLVKLNCADETYVFVSGNRYMRIQGKVLYASIEEIVEAFSKSAHISTEGFSSSIRPQINDELICEFSSIQELKEKVVEYLV